MDVSFLFPGDIEKQAEQTLVTRQHDELPSTILIAPHHGSRTSSTPLFLEAVSPETVIISCARDGRHHFPHPTVLERYRQRGGTDIQYGSQRSRPNGDQWAHH